MCPNSRISRAGNRNSARPGGVELTRSRHFNDVKTLSVKLIIALGCALCLIPWVTAAQEASEFPGIRVDSKLLRVQDQAEKIFERTEYERAFFIYRNELTPIGDKYAQYMVGFMYLTGKGVPEDRAVASAWYRLAAERGTKEFVGASDALLAILDDEQRARSDRQFLQLRQQYSDLTLMLQEVRKEMKLLKERTGSRAASSDTMPMTVVVANQGRAISGTDYYRRIEKRVQARLDYIESRTGIEIDDSHLVNVDLDAIEAQLNDYLLQVD